MKNLLIKYKIVILICSFIMVVSLFLPFATATDQHLETLEEYPSRYIDSVTDYTFEDMKNISLIKFAILFSSETSLYGVLLFIIGVSIIIGLFLFLLNKFKSSIALFSLSFLTYLLQVWDYKDRGVLPSYYYNWGYSTILFVIVALFVICGIVSILIVNPKIETLSTKKSNNVNRVVVDGDKKIYIYDDKQIIVSGNTKILIQGNKKTTIITEYISEDQAVDVTVDNI